MRKNPKALNFIRWLFSFSIQSRNSSRLGWVQLLIRRKFEFILDLLILISAFTMAYLLRFDFTIPQRTVSPALMQLPYVVLIQLMALMLTGVYAFLWRYIGMAEVKVFIN